MKDTDEILKFCCDKCDREKRIRVAAGTDPKVRPRCCRFFMRVLTRTTLLGDSPPLRQSDPGFVADVLAHGPQEAKDLLRKRNCVTAYDEAYASAIEAGYDHDEALEMASQASWDAQHDAR